MVIIVSFDILYKDFDIIIISFLEIDNKTINEIQNIL